MMAGEVYEKSVAMPLAVGQEREEFSISNTTGDRIVLEFVGINAFCQSGQQLFFSIHINQPSEGGLYPIAVGGVSVYSDPTYSARVFGSQRIKLYIEPEGGFVLTFARSSCEGEGRAIWSISGRRVAR